MRIIPLSLLVAVVATSLPVSAQQQPGQPVQQPGLPVQPAVQQPAVQQPAIQQPAVRPPRPRGVPIQPGQPQVPFVDASAAFEGNMKLTLEGNLFGVVPTDFSILSAGSSFSTDLPVKMDAEVPTIGTFEGILTPGNPWTVQIVLSARVPMKSGADNYEYRDFKFRTSARVTPGKKVTLWEKEGQKLVLGMEVVED